MPGGVARWDTGGCMVILGAREEQQLSHTVRIELSYIIIAGPSNEGLLYF